MSPELESLRYIVVLSSAALLLVALFPMRRLLRDLPDGLMRRAWLLLGCLLLVMIGAEIVYAIGSPTGIPLVQELTLPVVLLAGSWFIMIVCQLSAGSIEDVQRSALLEHETITDALTGTYNRRHMERVLGAEIERARRYGQPMCLALIDVDYFKTINDDFGHQMGDQILKQLSALIQSQARINETVARYGGEEFALILPGIGLQQAELQCDRIRARVAAEQLMVGDGEPHERISVTVSVGISQLSFLDGFRAEKLMDRADRAMYTAKRNGRNRTETVAPPVSGMSIRKSESLRPEDNEAA